MLLTPFEMINFEHRLPPKKVKLDWTIICYQIAELIGECSHDVLLKNDVGTVIMLNNDNGFIT